MQVFIQENSSFSNLQLLFIKFITSSAAFSTFFKINTEKQCLILIFQNPKAVAFFTFSRRQKCLVLWKYAANVQESTYAEIALWHGCFLVHLHHIFRTPFLITPLDAASVSSFHFLTESFSVYWEKKIVADFFYLGFISQTLMIHRTAVERRRSSLFLSTTFT